PGWDGGAARVAVVVATFRRAGFLPELVTALEAQDLPREDLEVVIVDDGSQDDTWTTLVELTSRTSLRLLALRRERNAGPGTARNLGVVATSAPVVCFTDDDCLPDPSWARRLSAAFEDDVEVVQGLVEPPASELATMGPWDHAIWVRRPTPFFETANVAYRRT